MYKNRLEAAYQLSKEIFTRVGSDIDLRETIILSLPNGGVPIGAFIANELTIPHNILISQKIGHPSNKNFVIGAITELDYEPLLGDVEGISDLALKQAIHEAQEIIIEKKSSLRPSHLLPPNLDGKTVILVAQGILSGQTISAAIIALKKQNINQLIVAVPLASRDASEFLKPTVDHYICLKKPALFMNLANFYEQFPTIIDDEVKKLLLKES